MYGTFGRGFTKSPLFKDEAVAVKLDLTVNTQAILLISDERSLTNHSGHPIHIVLKAQYQKHSV